MKNRIITLLISISPFLPQAQENAYLFDMTEFLSNMTMPWSVGNGTNPETGEIEGIKFDVVVYDGMNFNNHELEIMNTKITVYGDTINSKNIIFKYFGVSDLEVITETLEIPSEEERIVKVNMYPNPATYKAVLKGGFMEHIVVYDVDGGFITESSVNSNEYELDVSQFQNGVYIVQVWMSDNKGIVKKLIVQK